MSFYQDIQVQRSDWENWMSGKVAISVLDTDIGHFISLDEYKNRLLCQTWGNHTEDVIEAGCAVISDMTSIEYLERPYGGRYSDGRFFQVHEPNGNDAFGLFLPDDQNEDMITIIVDFGN